MKNIFTTNEVLISCSSLRSLNLKNMVRNIKMPMGELWINKIEIMGLLDNLKKQSIRKALNIAKCINNKYFGKQDVEIISNKIVNVLLNRRYRRGTIESNSPNLLLSKCKYFVENNKPLEMNISLFPCKIPNKFKTFGPLPDLADVLSLLRLYEICMAVKNVYKNGIKFCIFMDGYRFKDICRFSDENIKIYQKYLKKIMKWIKLDEDIELLDYIDFLDKKLPNKLKEDKKKVKEEYKQKFIEKVGVIDDIEKINEKLKNVRSLGSQYIKFADLFESLLYSIDFNGLLNNSMADEVLSDPIDTNIKDNNILLKRKLILQKTWCLTLDYISEIASGRIIKPIEYIFPNAIRCDMHNIIDRYTFYSVNRSTTLTSFHGTGYINSKMQASVKYRIQIENMDYYNVFLKNDDYKHYFQPFCCIEYLKSNDIPKFDIILSSILIK